MPLIIGKKKCVKVLKKSKEVLRDEVARGFTPKRIGTHIDSTGDRVLKNYLSFIEQKRQHCGHNEIKSQKNMFVSRSLID